MRLFTAESLQAMLLESSLAVIAERGVRVMSDYLPPKVSRDDEYERILELERKLGRRPEFAAVARYTQCLAHRAESSDRRTVHEQRQQPSLRRPDRAVRRLMPEFRSGSASPTSAISPAHSATAIPLARIVSPWIK